MIVAATDANCEGFNDRAKEIGRHAGEPPAHVVLAIPVVWSPHRFAACGTKVLS